MTIPACEPDSDIVCPMAGRADDHVIRRRPKDRKAQIARASAEAFSTLGYHGVSMELIASRVGISAAALYRHYSSKYDLFRGAVLNLGQQLVDGTAGIDVDGVEPQQVLEEQVSSLIDIAMANRTSGGLYRWEARYLRGEDQAVLAEQLRTVHRRIHRPLMALRPELTARKCSTLSTAVLSVIGSIVDHRAKLPAAHVQELLGQLALSVLAAELPDEFARREPETAPLRPAVDPSKYEALLAESMRLFNLKGYRDTSMDDIASAVGIPTSSIYKYFSGKNDILAASFRRAADRLSAELATIVATVSDPEEALATVIDAYVTRSFDRPELENVYYNERLNMTAADQRMLRDLQRSTVESWVELVVSVRPEWTTGQARFAVHAAMSLVVDLGRYLYYSNSPEARAIVERLADVTLLGHYRLRTALPVK
jgi:AcrR family transcriptional regulator